MINAITLCIHNLRKLSCKKVVKIFFFYESYLKLLIDMVSANCHKCMHVENVYRLSYPHLTKHAILIVPEPRFFFYMGKFHTDMWLTV